MKVSLQQIALPTSTGDVSVTDSHIVSDFVGAIFFGGGATSANTTTADFDWFIGACDATGRNVCCSQYAPDATSAAEAVVNVSDTYCIGVPNLTGGSLGTTAAYSSSLSDGVQLDLSATTGHAYLVNALMFAGADMQFAVSSVSLTSAENSATFAHNLSVVPQGMIVISCPNNEGFGSSGALNFSIGFYDGTNSIGFGSAIVDGANPTNVAAACGTANMGEYISQTPAEGSAWSVSAVGSSTLTISRGGSQDIAATVVVIAWASLNEVSALAFGNTTPDATGDAVVTSALAQAPQLWLSLATRLPSTAFTNNDSAGSWGFSAAVNNDGTTQQASIGASFEYDVSGSSTAKTLISSDASMTLTDAGAVNFASTVASWNANGITEDVSATDGNAYQRINLVFGTSIPAAPTPFGGYTQFFSQDRLVHY